MGDPGIVDEEMETPEALAHGRDEQLDRVAVAHVAARAVDGDAAGADRRFREECLRGNVPLGQVHVIDGDRDAPLGELQRRRPAEPGSAARDDRHPTLHRLGERLWLGPLLRGRRPDGGSLVRSHDPGRSWCQALEPMFEIEHGQVTP